MLLKGRISQKSHAAGGVESGEPRGHAGTGGDEEYLSEYAGTHHGPFKGHESAHRSTDQHIYFLYSKMLAQKIEGADGVTHGHSGELEIVGLAGFRIG